MGKYNKNEEINFLKLVQLSIESSTKTKLIINAA